MSLPVPTLDTRTWDELTAEAESLIPRYAPEWTDFNLSDPGITLSEQFAWVSELLMFRVDRVTPAMLRTFLRLVGVEQRPAGIGSTAVAFRAPRETAPVTLHAGTELVDDQDAVVFATTADLTVIDGWIGMSPADRARRGRIIVNAHGTSQDVSAYNVTGPAFSPLGPAPAPGDTMEIDLEAFLPPPGTPISLFIWTDAWRSDAALAQAIRAESGALRVDCASRLHATWPRWQECASAEEAAPSAAPVASGPLAHYWARTVWEYPTVTGAWRSFPEVCDETCALTLTGVVRLTVQPDHSPRAGGYQIRCRLAAGGYDCPPLLDAVALNAVPVAHAVPAPVPEDLGVSDGDAGLVRRLNGRPVIAGSTRVRLTAPQSRTGDPTIDDSWREVGSWDRTGPDDPHYLCDPLLATITFGDGRIGRVPPAGTTLAMRAYEIGGGPAGDIGAGRLTRIPGGPPGIVPVQPFATVGAASAETLAQAHGRALRLLGSVVRAVTADDLTTLALATPGAPLARAQALADHHPDFSCLPAPGVVTVVVVPRCGTPPQPSTALLALVRRYLERRRPVGTEVHVAGPRYVPVTVAATLHVRRGHASGIAAAAQTVLDRFFDPLTGGPAGGGWPFGRDVLDSELLAVLNELPNVLYVDGLTITTTGEAHALCGNLALCGTDLVQSLDHHFSVVEE